MRTLTKGQLALLVIVYVTLLTGWTLQISGSVIRDDALGTLTPAVNLVHHGVYSLDAEPPFAPTMYREPVPIAATSVAVRVVDAVLGAADLSAYTSGDRAEYVKMLNVLWLTLLCAAAFLATSYFTRSFTLSLITAVLSYLVFLYPAVRDAGIDSLYTDMPAAGLLLLSSWLLATGFSCGTWGRLVAAGLCFGALALTKAMALPVLLATLCIVAAYRLARSSSMTLSTSILQVAVVIVSCGVIVAPWIYRNWTVFHSAQISERGGLSMYMRALYNDVSPLEYRGLFYIWSPSPIRSHVGHLLGFTAKDLEPGGALIRVASGDDSPFAQSDLEAQQAAAPDRAVTLVAKARAERVKVRNEYRAAGYGFRTNVMEDQQLKDRALRMMLDRPMKAIAGAVTGLWRGGFLIVPLLVWAVIYAWRRQREDLLIFCMPALGFTGLLALFSVFEPRYSGPMTPLALVAAAVAAAGFLGYRPQIASRTSDDKALCWAFDSEAIHDRR